MTKASQKKLRLISIIFTLIWVSFWMVFAILSGAEDGGLLSNLPNALPWLVLAVALAISWKRPAVGGVVFFLYGLFTTFFFNTWPDCLSFLIISAPAFISAFLFLLVARMSEVS
ncbi:MAG: DUF7670 domain-containing protein [bacterium]